MINGMSVDQVKVEVQAPYGSEAQTQQPDVVTLRAQLTTGESVTQKAYFTVGQTVNCFYNFFFRFHCTIEQLINTSDTDAMDKHFNMFG